MDILNDIRIAHESRGNTYPRPSFECPECKGKITLCWGNIREVYARHSSGNSCRANCDMLTHSMAQDMLIGYLNSGGIVKVSTTCRSCQQVNNNIIPTEGITYHKEVTYGTSRLDIAGIDNSNKVVYCIEVYNKHRTTSTIDRNELTWIEISATDILSVLKNEALDSIQLNNIRTYKCEECVSNNTQMPSSSIMAELQRLNTGHSSHTESITNNKPILEDIEHSRGWCLDRAKRLGLYQVIDYTPCNVQKVLDMANYGNYRVPQEEWNQKGFSPENDEEDITRREYWSIRSELASTGKCLRCQRVCNVTPGKLFCPSCYSYIGRELHEERKVISVDLKMTLRNKLSWLHKVKKVECKINSICSVCKGRNNKYDPHYFDCSYESTVHWMYGDRNICLVCVGERMISDGLINRDGEILFHVY